MDVTNYTAGATPATVSFVIPTLNRGDLVIRAVHSALACETDEVRVQVVVLDSESDDGSWDALGSHFGSDPRVILHQNHRESGIVRSWIDGAQHATGQYVTFLWSDDWVFPNFAADLLPPLVTGAPSSRGIPLIRDVAESAPPALLSSPLSNTVSRAWAVAERYGALGWRTPAPPVSPACAIFRADVLDEWIDTIESVTAGNELRQELMWNRAFGPDAYLYLLALERPVTSIGHVAREVAQFSWHAESITVATSSWINKVGYWLTLRAVLERGRVQAGLRPRQLSAIYGSQIARGVTHLLRRVPYDVASKMNTRSARRWIAREVLALWRDAQTRLGLRLALAGTARGMADQAMRKLMRR